MHLSEAYRRYALDCSISNAEYLFDALVNSSDLCTFKDLNYKNSHGSLLLQSNGSSSGVSTKYLFGPNAYWWLYKIERYCKGGLSGHTVALDYSMNYLRPLRPALIATPNQPSHKHIIQVDIKNDIVAFTQHIMRLYDEVGEINILCQPYVMLYLLTHLESKQIITELHTRKIITNFITINSDAFYPRSSFVIDQMINWQSGYNFYYCQHKSLHTLSLVSSTNRNLLNAHQRAGNKIDDILRFNAVTTCSCGRTAYDMEFIPHIMHQISCDSKILRPFHLADNLKCTYINLQFLQTSVSDLNVYYAVNRYTDKQLHNDQEMIIEFFKEYKFNIQFKNNTAYAVGNKHPAFWKGDTGREVKII